MDPLSHSPRSKHLLAASIALFTFLPLSRYASGQIVENYDSYPQGTGVYTGSWKFINVDPAKNTTPVTSLSISSGAGLTWSASPVGGNYLMYENSGSWAGAWGSNSATGLDRTYTTEPWESSTGHFLRYESLTAGMTYTVNLWRQVQVENIASMNTEFSVWDAENLDVVRPFLNTPANLLTDKPYDTIAGGWQQVNLSFTVPGTPGAPHDVAFMMGIYDPSEVPASLLAGLGHPELDGNTRTVDPFPPTFLSGGTSVAYAETSRYFIDGFSLQQVPEPSVLLLAGTAALMVFRHRRTVAMQD